MKKNKILEVKEKVVKTKKPMKKREVSEGQNAASIKDLSYQGGRCTVGSCLDQSMSEIL